MATDCKPTAEEVEAWIAENGNPLDGRRNFVHGDSLTGEWTDNGNLLFEKYLDWYLAKNHGN